MPCPFRWLAIPAVLLAAVEAGAEGEPPRLPDRLGDLSSLSSISADRVRSFRLGRTVFEFEETPIDDIRDAIGVGIERRSGDASESMRWYCYSETANLFWVVSGEMGGGKYLTSVVAEAASPSDSRRASCPRVPGSVGPAALEFGWIGQSKVQLEQKLGAPSSVQGEWLLFEFSGKAPVTYSPPGEARSIEVEFDVTAFIAARIRDGAIDRIHASHVTSN